MDFRVLGPLEVWSGGRPLPVPGGRQRRLLAALLVHAGAVVETDRLIDLLWEAGPPITAREQVHNSVSSLRRTLAGGGFATALIETHGSGYRFCADGVEIDSVVFQAKVAAVRRLAVTGSDEARAEVLGEALALWRGPALAGTDMSDLRGERPSHRAACARS